MKHLTIEEQGKLVDELSKVLTSHGWGILAEGFRIYPQTLGNPLKVECQLALLPSEKE